MSSVPVRLPSSRLLRPEQVARKDNWVDKAAHRVAGFACSVNNINRKPYARLVRAILTESERLSVMTDSDLRLRASKLKQQFCRHGYTKSYLVQSFALVREAAGRATGMYHYESQIIGGLALYFGNVAEMQTGEGKTLTATLPAAAAALGGIPVHVITVNDYLARRDAELMSPVYEMMGLSAGSVIHEMDREQRQKAYAGDIVYCTNKELVFDYLKDFLVMKGHDHALHIYGACLGGDCTIESQLMLRGLHYAIVDEADSVLLDEARSPLVISGTREGDESQKAVFQQALVLARNMEEGRHYSHNRNKRQIDLLEEGENLAQAYGELQGEDWAGRIRRNELVHKALTAIFLFENGQHYIIEEGKIQIVDEHTGRVMADRSWEQGLHQLIEAKEGCELTNPRDTLARITYQRFFRMYHHLSGMTGTASEVSRELWQVYGLAVKKVPLHQPSNRTRLAEQLFPDRASKFAAVVNRVKYLHQDDHPVLIGTASVAQSERLSRLLDTAGIPHAVLNARNDADEADIVAQAGQAGQVTVATSMAGRGTDIKLAPESKADGGLHVILTEFHDAARIDRQLEGRCARQGDPGCYEVMVSLEDTLINEEYEKGEFFFGRFKQYFGSPSSGVRKLTAAQRRLEKKHAQIRKELFRQDEQKDDTLSFTSIRL